MSSAAGYAAVQDWRVLVRPECGLCDNLLQELQPLLAGRTDIQVSVLDVDEHPELQRKYGSRIPVVMIDGEVVCCYRLDHDRLRSYLGEGL